MDASQGLRGQERLMGPLSHLTFPVAGSIMA